jgi:hypothetical protein
VGRGAPARSGARGGEVVPSSRAARARLGGALAALGLAGAVAAWLALAAPEPALAWGSASVGLLALGLLGAGLAFRLPTAVPAGLAALGAEYGILLAVDGGTLDGRAPVVAAALFAIGELAYWSLELRDAVTDEAGAYLRRLGLLAGLSLGALALGIVLLAAVDLGERGGVGLEAVGAVAAVAALGLVALAARPRA